MADLKYIGCAGCGTTFSTRHYKRKYCTKECRIFWVDVAHGVRKVCALPRDCAYCGNTFTPSNQNYKTDYCSKSCYRSINKGGHQPKQAECGRCGKAFIYHQSKGGKFCSRQCTKQRTPPIVVRRHRCVCKLCKHKWWQGGQAKVFCATCVQDTQKYDRLYHKQRPSTHERTCTQCGVVFCRLYGEKITLCSDECRKEARRIHDRKQTASYNHRRRQRMFHEGPTENVDPFKVFEHNKWRCQQCGRKTPRKKRGTIDDNAPELDHIIPLSKGGTHTYGNVQCLCRKCNNKKSDSTDGLQMQIDLAI